MLQDPQKKSDRPQDPKVALNSGLAVLLSCLVQASRGNNPVLASNLDHNLDWLYKALRKAPSDFPGRDSALEILSMYQEYLKLLRNRTYEGPDTFTVIE